MIQSGKRVIIALTEEPEMFTSTYKHSEVKCQFDWVWSSESHVVSPWADTTDVSYLKDFLEVLLYFTLFGYLVISSNHFITILTV